MAQPRTNSAYQTRRAYLLGVFNGVVFSMGSAFCDSTTVLPIFVSRLTDSTAVIGLVSFIGASGWLLPQWLSAGWVQHQPYKRPNYILTTLLRGAGWAIAIPAVFLLAGRSPGLALAVFLLGYSVFSFGGGLGAAAFLDIVAKTVAPNRLGSFFANREFWGALGGVGCGLLVRYLLDSGLSFPTNYGLLFTIALALFVPGWVAFTFVAEPPSPELQPQSPAAFARSTLACVRADADFRRLLAARVLVGSAWIALPFYIVYCRQALGLPEAAVGTFLSLQMAGAVSANQVWGRISDRRSPRLVIVIVAALSLVGPTVALLATLLPLPVAVSRTAFAAVFFAIGATGGGTFIGFTNYTFAITPEARRPLYIGAVNTVAALPTCLPLLGGVLISALSFRALFAAAAVLTLAGAYLVIKLPPCTVPGAE